MVAVMVGSGAGVPSTVGSTVGSGDGEVEGEALTVGLSVTVVGVRRPEAVGGAGNGGGAGDGAASGAVNSTSVGFWLVSRVVHGGVAGVMAPGA